MDKLGINYQSILPETILSVVLTQREGESFPAANFLTESAQSGVNLYQAHLQGMNVAGFPTKEYFGFVVSDLSQEDVLEIASAIAPPLRNALDGKTEDAHGALQPACFSGDDHALVK